MNEKGLKWVSTFILCFVFWTLLTWSLAPREIILGVVISAIVAAVTGQYLIESSPLYLYKPVRLAILLFYYVIIFMKEVIKANISMVKIVLSPNLKNYQAGVIRIPGSDEIDSTYGLASVANCITLTPGTITAEVAKDEDGKNYYYVHWIDMETQDREKAADIIKGTMESWIGRIWK